jgi:hypothetical protein
VLIAGTTMLYPDDALEKLVISNGGRFILVVNTLYPEDASVRSVIPEL